MWLSELDCVQVQYGLAASLDKFDLARLKKNIRHTARHSKRLDLGDTWFSAVAPTRNTSRADYHVHCHGHWTKRDFHGTIEYFQGSEKSLRGERGPFAEDIIPWLGQFFKNERATAHVTASFLYVGKKWTPSLPLPMRIPIASPREVKVVGMVANIPMKPEGAYEAFIALRNHTIVVVLQANRPMRFKGFHLYRDVMPLSSVARLFAREIKK